MGLRKHIRQIDFIKIKKAVADGHDCQVISQSLRLDYDRVADIITSLPKGEKAEFEAKERHKVRVAKSNDEDYTPKKYKAKKTKTPTNPTAPIKVQADSMPPPIPGSTAIT